MEHQKRSRLQVWTPLLFALVMAAGMVLGFKLHDSLRFKRDIETVVERNDRLGEMIDLINAKYVDSVNSSLLYGDAVKGILSHLDPHTVYIPAEEVAGVNENLEGSFYGIGVEFAIIRDTIAVTAVVPGGPSERAGVAVGDKLIKVNDTLVAGNGITSDGIVQMLRGHHKTTVQVTVKSVLASAPHTVQITRDEVPLYSVEASLMLDGQTGFIRINRFAATTYSEFARALKSLKAQGAQQLIIDLRENPGGYLDAATNIADELLDDHKLIVFTQGAHSEKTEYKADKQGMFEDGRVAVLVDENSASAAEILTGAVQDWDRGIVVGRRTFGKGLVQEQYDLEDGSALRLTVARYFTPSGRSIQRSFEEGKAAYEEAYEHRFQTGELTGQDSLVKEDTIPYYTLVHRRLVHGGGGIKPDVYVPYDSGRLSPGLLGILVSDGMQDAVWDYYSAHAAALKQYRTVADLIRSFKGETEVLQLYLNRLSSPEQAQAGRVLQRAANRDYLLLQIRSQVARILFRNNGYYAVNSRGDDVVQRALQLLHSDQYLKIIGR